MFICIDIFRWVLNTNAPLLTSIFHGVQWLHLLVFRQETTTKNLQLLQTWVTKTLSCVWLWSTYTFFEEEMKRQPAATQRHHAWPAATQHSEVRTSPLPHRSFGTAHCCSQKPAGSKGDLCLAYCPKMLSISWLDFGQPPWSFAFRPVADWPRWKQGFSTSHQGSLEEHCCHTLMSYFGKLPKVVNTDFSSKKRTSEKASCINANPHSTEPPGLASRTPAS